MTLVLSAEPRRYKAAMALCDCGRVALTSRHCIANELAEDNRITGWNGTGVGEEEDGKEPENNDSHRLVTPLPDPEHTMKPDIPGRRADENPDITRFNQPLHAGIQNRKGPGSNLERHLLLLSGTERHARKALERQHRLDR